MKADGIKTSKRRRAIYENNRDVRMPPPPAEGLSPAVHKPTPNEDGSLFCSGCSGAKYSPAAFAAHLAGKPITDSEGGVYTTGPGDPWLVQRHQDPEHQRRMAEEAEAAWRAELIKAYHEQQHKPRIAEGVSKWITETDEAS